MNRTTTLLGLSLTAAAVAYLTSISADAQGPTPIPSVWLQPTSAGTMQTGNANVSGTMRAGQLVGGGAGLTGLNATNLATGMVSAPRGGTGMGSYTAGDLIFAFDSTSLSRRSIGPSGSVLKSSVFGYPVWEFISGDSITAPLIINGGFGGNGVIQGISNANTTGSSGVSGRETSADGAVYGVYGESMSTSGAGVFGWQLATSGVTMGGWFQNQSTGGRAVFGNAVAASGATYGGYFAASSTSGTGVLAQVNQAGAVALSAVNTAGGVAGLFTGRVGIGTTTPLVPLHIAADADPVMWIQDTGSNSNQVGYISYRNGSSTETAWVGYGSIGDPDFSIINARTNGDIVLASYGSGAIRLGPNVASGGLNVQGDGDVGIGTSIVGAQLDVHARLGQPFAVDAVSDSTIAVGVRGNVTSLTGNTYGGNFVSASTLGTGVQGYATAASGTIYGVYGRASTASSGYGVFANGDTGASGTKSFRIDHPADPENKYLLHYSSESPFPQNFYNGNVTTDAKGYAWVELPDYFADINTNFKYQLTVIDDSDEFVLTKVTQEIQSNRFQIRSSKPSTKISWMVFADRNDERIKFNRPSDVRDKGESERGKYQHPEYFGKPKEMGMNYRPEQTGAGQSQRK